MKCFECDRAAAAFYETREKNSDGDWNIKRKYYCRIHGKL